jgi:integrase
MASVHRDPRGKSQFWYAAYKLPNGRRQFHSTKSTNRKEAQKIADAWEEAARRQATETQFRRIMNSIWEQVSGRPLASSTSRAFFERWKTRKEKELGSDQSVRVYRGVVHEFIKHLEDCGLADEQVSRVTPSDVVKYRDLLLERVTPVTASKHVKVIRGAFQDALREHLISENPARVELVGSIRKKGKNGDSRRPFKLTEIQSLLRVATGEWRGLILFGLYTGQRLGDIARLLWINLNLERGEISFVTSKTGRQQIIPIAGSLRDYIENELPVSDDLKAPLFPKTYQTIANQGNRVASLSRQFYEDIMTEAGLVPPRSRKNKGVGRSGRREWNGLSFHCLRHTATSLMKEAGIPESVVRDIVGHESKAVSANYTHVDEAAKRVALEKYAVLLSPQTSAQQVR